MKKYSIEKIIEEFEALQLRAMILPFELLGRTLAYNNFMPRLNYTDLSVLKGARILKMSAKDVFSELDITSELRGLGHNSTTSEAKGMQPFRHSHGSLDNECKDFTHQDTTQNYRCIDSTHGIILFSDLDSKDLDLIDSISTLRRLRSEFIAYDGLIFDVYQVLEICIAGADMFVFDYEILFEFVRIKSVNPHPTPPYNNTDNENLTTQNLAMENITAETPQAQNLSINNLSLNLAREILNFSNDLGLIPIFRLHSKDEFDLLSSIYNIECVMCKEYFSDENLPESCVALDII